MTKFYARSLTCFIFLVVLFVSPITTKAQQTKNENIDFSLGNFTNWVGYTSCYPFDTHGSNIKNPGNNGVTPISQYYYKEGIVDGRHTIITSASSDPFTCGQVMTIPQGVKYAARLGNGGIGPWGDGVAWQREFLSYDFVVSSTSSLLTFKYAVVLQDSNDPNNLTNHTIDLRPRFAYTIRDNGGNIIDPVCGRKEVFYDSTNILLHKCLLTEAQKLGAVSKFEADLIYTDWTTVSFDLRRYIGKTVNIRFETWDCGMGGHFGYAYLTAKSGEMKINSSSCTPDSSVTLTAPDGFRYKWDAFGDTTQSITVKNPQAGDVVSVELTTESGCKTSLKKYLFQDVLTANFKTESKICTNAPAQFTDASAPSANSWRWDFGDGTIDSVQNPVHIYKKAGDYIVFLSVKNTDACEDTVSKSISVCDQTGFHNEEMKINMRAFPNPLTGSFNLQVEQANIVNVRISITNILGQVIYADTNLVKNGFLQKELDLKEQPDGIYFVTVQNQEFNSTIKLIKRN